MMRPVVGFLIVACLAAGEDASAQGHCGLAGQRGSSALPLAPIPVLPPAMPVAPTVAPAAPSPWMPSLPLGDGREPAGASYSTSWRRWWRYNGDPYLDLRAPAAGMPESGARATRGSPGGLPSKSQIRTAVVPALQRALQEASSAELVRGALIALARIGRGHDVDGLALDDAARFYLGRDHQPTAEASLVAVGLRADPSAADMLVDLLENTEAGRALRGGEWVDARIRVFAAYSLGLMARRCEDPSVRAEVGRALTRVLVTDATTTFELHVALMLSIGLAPLDACDGSVPVDLASLDEADAHFCLGTQIVALLDCFRDPERPLELRAHAAVPLARLTGGASAEYKKVVADALIEAIDRRSKVPDSVRHSCAVALGVLGDGDDDRVDKDVRDALRKAASRGEDLLRRLSMVALASATARPGRGEGSDRAASSVQKFLESKLATGRDDTPAWAAIALAILGHGRSAGRDAGPEGIAASLRGVLHSRSDDHAVAAALGLGLLRDHDSCEDVMEQLESDSLDVRSYAALALGMIGARDALPTLRAMLEDEADAPDAMFLGSASIAMRLLGDERAAEGLLSRVDEIGDADDRVAIVSAAGVVGDSAAVPGLIALMEDDSRSEEVRGAAALALGVLCDERPGSWAATLSAGINYNLLTWTLQDPFGDGLGILDMR